MDITTGYGDDLPIEGGEIFCPVCGEEVVSHEDEVCHLCEKLKPVTIKGVIQAWAGEGYVIKCNSLTDNDKLREWTNKFLKITLERE